jgi:pantetheine-phosphate adenylyltransferase
VALHGIERVEVHSFDGFLVETARSLGTTVILRGLRAVSDFEYELQMANMNRRLVSEVDTLLLTPAEHYAYLSASLVREIASLGGDVGPFVHPDVASALVVKLRAGKC